MKTADHFESLLLALIQILRIDAWMISGSKSYGEGSVTERYRSASKISRRGASLSR
jgi:hypothetical protein